MSPDRASYARLLRWYPKGWRERNGEVLLGAMLEDAERRGRMRPTTDERRSAVVFGLGTRLDARLALICAVAVLLVMALIGIGLMAPLPWDWAVHLILLIASTGVYPVLVVIGAVSLGRHRGWLTEPRALVLLSLAAPSLILAALASVSWSVGFDTGYPSVSAAWFASAWIPLVAAGWILGAAAVSVSLATILERTRLPLAVTIGVSAIVGGVVAALIGASLLSPYTTAAAAAGLALLVLLPLRSPHATAPRRTQPTREDMAPSRRLSRILAWIAAAGGACGVAYAFTGAHWSTGATDSTIAMAQGITISLVSWVPFLSGIGLALAPRALRSPAHTWGPLLLLGLSFLALALGYVGAPAWGRMAPGFIGGSALGGAALAWWTASRLRGSVLVRAVVAVAIGAGFAALQGMFLAPLLSFALPLVAAVFATWGLRSGDHAGTAAQGRGVGYGPVPQS